MSEIIPIFSFIFSGISISLLHTNICGFIPKLCNIEMINNLPGVNKVNKNSIGATGVIETPINTLPGVLFDFISKVPTDYDMVNDFEEIKRNRRRKVM